MLEVSIAIQDSLEVIARLDALANAARVFGSSRAEVGTEDPVGRYVTEGTRPHLIYPRDKQALFWPGARHPVGVVHHPGTAANPFLERAAKQAGPAIEAEVARRLDMVASGGGSNYTQTMEAAGKLLLDAARKEAPVGAGSEARPSGSLRRSLYLV